ncbi:hypothetical protein [Undibacterium sp. Xuan67W]|uniref:hypothetical protein n=1 Tax=Undibacterium sp. Xuan67W TaxID=3413057 RepID=UPI003BF23CA6
MKKDVNGDLKNGVFQEGECVCIYKDGKIHCENGPAKINFKKNVDGSLTIQQKSWYLNDELHREDGPAIEYSDGGKEWWINGERHRDDGPACIYKDPDEGDFFYEWFRNGGRVTEQEIEQFIVKKNLNEKLHVTLAEKHREKRAKI